MTWLEYQRMALEMEERAHDEIERTAVWSSFKQIQLQVQQLLTANVEGPDDEKLNLQEFNMDLQLVEETKQRSQEDCLIMKEYFEKLIIAQDKVTTWIKKYLWDTMLIKGKVICAIFANFEVENFTLLPPDGQQQEVLKCVQEYRRIEQLLSKNDTFEPWIPQSERYRKQFIQFYVKRHVLSLSEFLFIILKEN